MPVYLSKIVCAKGHPSLAAANEFENDAAAANWPFIVAARFHDMVNRGILYPFCAICGSRAYTVETVRTRHATLEAAEAELNLTMERAAHGMMAEKAARERN